jgi:splicing factor 3B subunit 3
MNFPIALNNGKIGTLNIFFIARIIAAIGKTLVLFEFGKDSLKKICELIMGKTFINNIHLSEDKIFITESAGVQHVINYDEKQKTFLEIARDFMPRFATASAILDSYTIVGADKFENVYVNNMPLDID